MKRQRFRLGVVLRHYELQKQRAEQDLHQASRVLHEIDAEIDKYHAEVAALGEIFAGRALSSLSATSWIACGQRSEHLGRRLAEARMRRERQASVVAQCAEKRKRWAVAEEMLLSLRHKIETANHAAEEKALQLQLQETILRGWLGADADQPPLA